MEEALTVPKTSWQKWCKTIRALSCLVITTRQYKVLGSISPLQNLVAIVITSFGSMLTVIIRTTTVPYSFMKWIEPALILIVVAMATVGVGVFQKATALAQNSKLGNGGAKHRKGAKGHWTDHGHHAAMRIEAFKQVGGYDESFTHNEDAELDCRLTAAGFRISMTGPRAHMVYFPDLRPGLFSSNIWDMGAVGPKIC